MKTHGDVKGESYLLTAAVLAVGFGFSSEGNWFRAGYLVVFLAALGLDFRADDTISAVVNCPVLAIVTPQKTLATAFDTMVYHPTYAIFSVAALQFFERLIWHVVQDRKFPDWLKEA